MARRTRAKKISHPTNGHYRKSSWILVLAWVIPLVLALGTVFTPGALWTTAAIWGLILVALGLLHGYSYKGEVMPLLCAVIAFVIFMQWAPVSNVLYLGTFINAFLGWFLVYLSPLAFVVVFRKIYSTLR